MKKEEFLKLVAEVHGDKFDYSLVPEEFQYKEKLPVVCPKHGVFHITVGNHIHNGRGCAKCGFEYVASLKRVRYKEKFFTQAPVIHKNKYDYSKCEFYTSSDKAVIICPIHGEFLQSPEVHMRGSGCAECGRLVSSAKQKYKCADFIAAATNTHGDTYDYSELNFMSYDEKVDIICKIHGKFKQDPNNHITGNGCPACVKDMLREKFKMPEEEFFSRVKSNFPELDFSETVYTNNQDLIEVNCPTHGKFKKKGWYLIQGYGCTRCARNLCGYKSRKNGTLYILKVTEEVCKFGITNSMEERLAAIRKKSCFDIELLYRFDFEDGSIPKFIESQIIASDIQRHVVNRCDMQSGYTETFDIKDLAKVLSIVHENMPA